MTSPGNSIPRVNASSSKHNFIPVDQTPISAKTQNRKHSKQSIPVVLVPSLDVPESKVNINKMQNHSLDDLSHSSIPKIVHAMEKDEAAARNLLEASSALKHYEATITPQIIDKMFDDGIKKILADGTSKAGTTFEITAFEMPVGIYKKELDLSKAMQPFLIEEAFIKECPQLELAVVGVNLLSHGSVVFTSAMLLNKIKEAIKAKEQYLTTVAVTNEGERNAIEQEISILKKWVDVRKSIISSSTLNAGIHAVTSSPKALSAIATMTKVTGTVISNVVDWVGLGIGLVSSALSFHASRVNFKKHDDWTAAIAIKGEGDAIYNPKNEKEVAKHESLRKSNVDVIIERQRKSFVSRFESSYPALANRIKAVLPDFDISSFSNIGWEPSQEVFETLRGEGIDLSEIYEAVNELKKQEMLSGSVKKGLLAFNQKKDDIDKGFLQQEINKTGALLTAASLLTGAVIVLKALLIAGVIASTVALSSVGFTMIPIIVGTLVAGAVYLYIKKPNIFKTYLKAVQLRMFFWNIPMTIQKFRSNYAQLEEMKVADQIGEIKARLKADSLEDSKELQAKQKKAEQLERKISELEKSIKYLDGKLKPLQEEVALAGWKDFQLSLERKAGRVNAGAGPTKEPEDDALILAEYILEEATSGQNSEIRKLLLHMDVNLNRLTDDDNKVSLKAMVAARLHTFFAMETDETLGMINKQNLLVQYGLRENIANS